MWASPSLDFGWMWKVKVGVTQSCLTLCNPMDYTVHGILQARILEWVAFPSPGHLPSPGIEPRSPSLQADSLPAVPPGKLLGKRGRKCYSSSTQREAGKEKLKHSPLSKWLRWSYNLSSELGYFDSEKGYGNNLIHVCVHKGREGEKTDVYPGARTHTHTQWLTSKLIFTTLVHLKMVLLKTCFETFESKFCIE